MDGMALAYLENIWLDLKPKNMKASVCIVNLNAKKHLDLCLSSLPEALDDVPYETIVVDNHSSDGSVEYLEECYTDIHILKHKRNEGYTRAINAALKMAKGDFIVVLNPDAVPDPDSLITLIRFLEKNLEIGICGPKVVNKDGSFQKSCRRGIARPGAVFSYFLGLAKLYPTDTRFTGYHLNHLDENEINEVDGISGSCMVIRRELMYQVGLFDERFFAYQEDSDYCLRTKEKGWKVFYNPESLVTHTGGAGGSGTFPMRSIFEWHRSYYKYYYKHFSGDYPAIFNIFYSIFMVGKLLFAEVKYFLIR